MDGFAGIGDQLPSWLWIKPQVFTLIAFVTQVYTLIAIVIMTTGFYFNCECHADPEMPPLN